MFHSQLKTFVVIIMLLEKDCIKSSHTTINQSRMPSSCNPLFFFFFLTSITHAHLFEFGMMRATPSFAELAD